MRQRTRALCGRVLPLRRKARTCRRSSMANGGEIRTQEGKRPVPSDRAFSFAAGRDYSLADSASSSKGGKGKAGKGVSPVGSGLGSAVPSPSQGAPSSAWGVAVGSAEGEGSASSDAGVGRTKDQTQSKKGLIRWQFPLLPPRAGRGRRAKAFPLWVRDLAPPCRRLPRARRPPLGAWP